MTGSAEGAAPALAETRPWDPVEYPETPDDAIAYLEAAFEDGGPRVIAATVGDVAHCRGMTSVAAGRTRQGKPVQGAFARRQSGLCNHAQRAGGLETAALPTDEGSGSNDRLSVQVGRGLVAAMRSRRGMSSVSRPIGRSPSSSAGTARACARGTCRARAGGPLPLPRCHGERNCYPDGKCHRVGQAAPLLVRSWKGNRADPNGHVRRT